VVAAEVPCEHGSYVFSSESEAVTHTCHCGREHSILVPSVVCAHCGATETHSVISTAETCHWEEQRRRLIAVDEELQRGKVTWGTFSILN
jgi:hypothetical protein